MKLEDVKIKIQDFFEENTLTIVGSGLSCAEGIPGMRQLTIKLQDKIPKLIANKEDINLWREIDKLLNDKIGLEGALHQIQPSLNLESKIKEVTAQFIREAEETILSKIVRSNEKLRFSDYISRFNLDNGPTVITTNYDRLIEYSCERSHIRINTLFTGQFMSHFSGDENKYSFIKKLHPTGKGIGRPEYMPRVKILKPHGCLSWYLIDDTPYSIPNETGNDCLIITPGLNKYKEGYKSPFDAHREHANREIDNASKYIIIGYGFGDEHLEEHLNKQIKNKPTLIVTHSLSDKAIEVYKQNNNVTALTYHQEKGAEGTKVYTKSEEIFFPDINLWDIRELVREVF